MVGGDLMPEVTVRSCFLAGQLIVYLQKPNKQSDPIPLGWLATELASH